MGRPKPWWEPEMWVEQRRSGWRNDAYDVVVDIVEGVPQARRSISLRPVLCAATARSSGPTAMSKPRIFHCGDHLRHPRKPGMTAMNYSPRTPKS